MPRLLLLHILRLVILLDPNPHNGHHPPAHAPRDGQPIHQTPLQPALPEQRRQQADAGVQHQAEGEARPEEEDALGEGEELEDQDGEEEDEARGDEGRGGGEEGGEGVEERGQRAAEEGG